MENNTTKTTAQPPPSSGYATGWKRAQIHVENLQTTPTTSPALPLPPPQLLSPPPAAEIPLTANQLPSGIVSRSTSSSPTSSTTFTSSTMSSISPSQACSAMHSCATIDLFDELNDYMNLNTNNNNNNTATTTTTTTTNGNDSSYCNTDDNDDNSTTNNSSSNNSVFTSNIFGGSNNTTAMPAAAAAATTTTTSKEFPEEDEGNGSFLDLFYLCEHGSIDEIMSFLGLLECGYFGAEVDINTRSDSGYTALHIACYSNRGDVVEALLAHGADPNRQDFKQGTPLLLSVKMNSEQAFNVLTGAAASGATCLDPDIADINGVTPLFLACANSLDRMVWRLLGLGASPSSSSSSSSSGNFGASPLYAAAKTGNASVVRGLLRVGADPNEALGNGNTPLIAALEGSWHACAATLLAAGASAVQANRAGVTPLHMALFVGDEDVAAELLRRGAGPLCAGCPDQTGVTPLHMAVSAGRGDLARCFLEECGADPNASYGPASTPLYAAVCAGRADMVALLLAHGADPNRMTAAGLTPLQLAARDNNSSSSRGTDDMLVVLLEHGADPCCSDAIGTTPLHVVAATGRIVAIKALLARGADFAARTLVGDTPLLIAVEHDHAEVVEILLEAAAASSSSSAVAQAMAPNGRGETPALLAARIGSLPVLEALLPYAPDLDAASKNGDYPLLAAARGGFTPVMEALLAHGVTIPRENEAALGPLWHVSANGNIEAVELLLRYGSDPSPYVAVSRNPAITMLLVMNGAKVLPREWTATRDSAPAAPLHALVRSLVTPKVDPHLFRLPALGCPLGVLRNTLKSLGELSNPDVYLAADPSIFDVDTRDENGETLLHWAMKTGNKVVITELIRKGFDMNAREYISATTPMFFLRDKLLYNELTRQNAQWKDVWDKEGHALRNLFSPTRGIPQVHVETLHVAVVGDVQYSPKARYSTAEGFILGATLPENHIYQQQQQQQQQQPQQRESLNRVTADPLRPDRFSWTSRTPSGAIAAYITGTSQSPQCTPSNSPLLSTSPALPSSSCRTRKRAGLAPSRYPIVWYDTLPGSGDTKLCVQIGDYHWYKERNEAVDIVIFAYTVADTHSLHSLVHDTMPDIIQHTGGGRRFRDRAGSGDDSSSSSSDSDSDSDSDKDSSSNDKGCRKWAQSVRKATYVLVGIGKEARSDPEMAANCAKMHSLLRTPVQCREIAEYCGMHGFMEWEQSPESFRALLYEAVKVHVARTTATTTAGADAQSSTLCGVAQVLRPPLPCEVRAKQAKVLFLGHQGTGKSSLLRHLVEEDAASKHRTFARLLKSTRGNSNSNNNSNSNDGDLNGSDENGGGGGGSSSSNSSKRGTTAAMTSLSLSSVNSHREVELNGLAQGCTVRVLDFAGQIECTSAYEIFFSSFNTLYVITVNAASPNTTAQLRHWLEVLEQSRHGPYTDAALLIVCTMIDLIPNGRDGATVKEVEVTHEVQAWEISKRMEVRVVLASSRTGEGIKTVASTIASYAQAIARHRVPRVFRKAQRAMTKFPPEAISYIVSNDIVNEINRIDSWDRFAQYLHDVGVAVMEPGREYLCMKAGVMARMIGAFVAPPAHMRSLFFQSTCGGGSSNNNTNNAKDSNQQQQQQQQQPQQQQQQQQRRVRYDIVTHDEAIARLLMLNRADAEHLQVLQCEVGLQFMTEYGLCAPLTEAETRMYGKAGYVFPSLRYPCEVLAIPFLGDTTPVPPHVFVRRCTEWLCKACGHRAPSEPPSGCGCPFCGVAGCGAQVCSACHGDMHPELGPCGNLFLAKSTTALADGTVPCVPVGASSSSSSSSPQSSEAEAEVAATVSVPLRLAQCGCVDVRNGWEGKTLLGYRLRSSRNDLCFGAFSKLMMQLRPLIDPRYRVFSNLVALRDAIGNDIFVAFQPAALEGAQAAALVPAGPAFCDPHRGDAFIYIAVYGVTPCAWKSTVPALLEVCDVVEPLCLRCLQTDTFSVLLPPSANEGSDGNKNGSNVSSSGNNGSKAELICALGHKQQKQPQQQQKQYALTVARGVPLNPLARRNKLWAPLYRDKFYECSEGLWEVQGPARVTVLTDTEKTPARREEYLRARNAFYQFVGTNMEDVIRLTKVEFIQNDALETPFTGFSDKLTKRALVLDVPSLSSSSSSSSSTPNLLDGIMKELDSPNNNNNNSERRRGGGGGTSSNDKQEWGEWILGQLQKSMYRISGNEGINLILGWHGTSEANIRSIVQNNFYDMSDPEFAASRKTDPGFFGPGIYFSQYPTYGSSYAEKRKSNTLLLSWVLMGATYPVTEEPMTLTGLVPGYDSHYAIVDSKFGRPIRPTDPPGYDEIVVFHKAQVLPRYVIHFEKIDAPSTPHDPGSQTAAVSLAHKLLSTTNSAFPGEPLPPDIRDAYPVFIWIDPDFNTVDATMSGFKIIYKKITVKKCTSAIESKAFLLMYGKQISSKLYVITNRYRQQDGGDNAWENTVRVVKECGLNDVPITIFCGAPEKIQKHVTSWKNVYIHTNAKDILLDCMKRFKVKK